jgi:transposase InsO family protein
MAAWLATQGHRVNRKRVQRLMRMMALVAINQRPRTSKPAAAHKICPYLLGSITIERVNQDEVLGLWCMLLERRYDPSHRFALSQPVERDRGSQTPHGETADSGHC